MTADEEFLKRKREEEQKLREKLKGSYQDKGFQKISYKEYLALQEKSKQKKPLKLPPALKYIFMTPIIIVFCCGLIYIPYTLFSIATGSESDRPYILEDKPTNQNN